MAVVADEVDLDTQQIPIKRTASDSGGRRDPREGAKTSAGVRIVVFPDIAMPSVRRLLQRGAQGRELSKGSCTVASPTRTTAATSAIPCGAPTSGSLAASPQPILTAR